ncbi:hypothetical protein [Nocardia gipuzkoensis]
MSGPRPLGIVLSQPAQVEPFTRLQRLAVLVLVFVIYMVLTWQGSSVETAIGVIIALGFAAARIAGELTGGALPAHGQVNR